MLFAMLFFKKNETYSIYVNFDFDFILIFEKCYRRYYSNQFNYSMLNNKKLKYVKIEFDSIIFIKCVDIFICLYLLKSNIVKLNI